ncbi:MAG: hypothetical protein M1818_003515 [Claussenomyces sp. TS43310]|nr:MAG: hypothetical protein M1818_003515 [Claussenomyces sp. TS43310]
MEQGNPYRPRYQFPPTFSPSDLRGVAEFLNVDSDRWVFRRFGKLHLFNILGMQQRLARLQHELDMQISGEEPSDFDKLLPAIQHALSEYDAALSAHAKYKSYKEPGDSIVEQLDYWGTSTKENGEPLRHGLDIPCRGTKNRKDLASIAAVEKTWTHRFIDRHACLAGVFKEVSMSKPGCLDFTSRI